jgi:hypothetical protein
MSGFTKLVPEIVQSSIWNESSDVRIVWITLLAIKDEHGFVRGNAQTIARIANVTLEAAQMALTRFQEPDPSSNTPDNEGRRIAPIPGGWCVLNHSLYRGKTYNEYEAERKKKYREEKQAVSGTCPGHVPSASASASASASVSDSVDSSKKGVQGETAKPHSFKQWTREDLTASVHAANADGFLLPDEVADFVEYWTEPTASGRFRLTLEKTWDTRRRMKTAFSMIYEGKRKVTLPIDEHPVRWLGGEKMWDVPGVVYDDFVRRYPGVDLDAVLIRLNDWLHQTPNAQKCKSFRGMIENSLKTAKDNGGR